MQLEEKKSEQEEPAVRFMVVKAALYIVLMVAVFGTAGNIMNRLTATTAGVGENATTTAGNRELPIYCVGTDKKQLALSFDAAWGNV